MEPIEEFDWTLKALRKLFQLIAHDVFQENQHHGPIYYTFLLLYFSFFVCILSTIITEQDFNVRFVNGALLLAITQVILFIDLSSLVQVC